MSDRTGLGKMLEETVKAYRKKSALFFEGKEISFEQLDENVNRLANGLRKLGIQKGDRVAMMLPNIPEFVYSFFALQKLGAIAVPFNTMYKGREILHILNDSEARAIITLTNFAPLINELKSDAPALEHIILTGERTLLFVHPESTVAVQMVHRREFHASIDETYKKVGDVFVDVLKKFGVDEAWYKHRGSVRVGGRKIASFTVSEMENLVIVNGLCFLSKFQTDDFFKVIWIPPEIKDKVVEPLTSIEEETGKRPEKQKFKDAVVQALETGFGVKIQEGSLKRDELFAYEKQRALAYKT
jgi:long-chain acyl-CoA synthetase